MQQGDECFVLLIISILLFTLPEILEANKVVYLVCVATGFLALITFFIQVW